LAVGYGGKIVVSRVDLDLPPRKTIALLGINGAGKSTTLKGIAGVLQPERGLVQLDGIERVGRTASANARAGLVFVPEGARSFDKLSVLENLELGGFVIPDRALLRRRRDEMLDLFPRLRDRAYLPAGSLSGGERQMLGIARALMLRPKVLLLDEPLLGLAPIMIDEVKGLIQRVQADAGCGLLIAEQHVNSILPICHEAFVLREGVAEVADLAALLHADERDQAAALFGV
jgi:branched-chain amino acid transport system ATP-binding protein